MVPVFTKKIVLAGRSISAALALIFCSCSGGNDVSLTDAVTVRYNEPVGLALKNGLLFDESLCTDANVRKVLDISPKVEFSTSLSPDGSMLYLYPSEHLKYNSTYTIKGRLASLAGGKGSRERITVHVLPPLASLKWSPLILEDGAVEGKNTYCVRMEITGQDPLDSAYLEKKLVLPAGVESVCWSHSADGLNHTAEFGGIRSSDEDDEVCFSFNYEEYSLKAVHRVFIPRSGIFCVTGVEMTPSPYSYAVSFSELLDPRQDFRSVVALPGAGSLTFVADRNVLKIFPSEKAEENQDVHIFKSVRNVAGGTMEEEFSRWFRIPGDEPSIRFLSEGSILPSVSGLNIYFESSNYRKARVRCHRIYESNVLQFLQGNRLHSADSYISDVAREILDTVFLLGNEDEKLRIPASYGINLSEMVKIQKGAIYKVEIGGVEPLAEFREDRYESEYYMGSWEDYGSRARNVLVSDLAAIAKESSGGMYRIAVMNVLDASPVPDADVRIYNDVNQLVASGKSGKDGVFECRVASDRAATVVITSGSDKAYLRLAEGESLSLSNFDVAGTVAKDGCKAFIFGERGVWRPGDEVHLCFIAVPQTGRLPQGHPVSASLFNPQGQMICRSTAVKGSDGMYLFTFKTDRNAPTGKWNAVFTMGGQHWNKTVRIETVKPNNILVDLEFDSAIQDADSFAAVLKARMQAGTPAAGLKVKVDADLSRAPAAFDACKGYVFNDDTKEFIDQTVQLYAGTTDESGNAALSSKLDLRSAPGLVNAVLTTRVFEKSGDFSTNVTSMLISPYRRYVGLHLPLQKNDWGEDYLDIASNHALDIVSVDKNGRPVGGNVTVDVEVYKMEWSWWWTSSPGLIAEFARDNFSAPYKSFRTVLRGGKASVSLNFRDSQSGLYCIRVKDADGGHSASAIAMVCRKYEGASSGEMTSAVTLPVSANKTVYPVGETAVLTIPSAEGARALVSIEKGGTVLDSFWQECSGGSTVVKIPVTEGMAPNVYVSITLVQPYNSTLNDAPIRMFGVLRLNVEDASTRLHPVVSLADEVRPESKLCVKVSEKDGRPMSFVLAVVDEGLLNLTSFKTPDPWKSFFATEALTVRTWDLYNSVIGAYGAGMSRIFAVGGDGEQDRMINPDSKASRFTPLAIMEGPYQVRSHGSCKVELDIPRYIGNVRVMAIASDGRNMGSSQRNVKVTKPIMVKMTLPRVVGTDDIIQVPVTVYATKDNVGQVKVSLDASGNVSLCGGSTASVRMDREGEKTVYLSARAASVSGVARFKAVCTSAGDSSTDEAELDVRDANPETGNSVSVLLEPGAGRTLDLRFAGRPLTNTASIEASTIPAPNLNHHIRRLLSYPHGCLEQTVSCAFPLLYLPAVADVDETDKERFALNVQRALAVLPSYAIPSGGFTTWPGTSSYAGENLWAGIYAAHFMVEASKAGYSVPSGIMNAALSYARRTASAKRVEPLGRAYAAYVLALSGKADRSSMARLRESKAELPRETLLMLSCAYSADGRKDVADELTALAMNAAVNANDGWSYTSEERVLALTAKAYMSVGRNAEAFPVVRKIADCLSDRDRYMSTQTVSWTLGAIAEYASRVAGGSAVDVTVRAAFDGAGTGKGAERVLKLEGGKTVVSADLEPGDASGVRLELTNNSSSAVYVTASSSGKAQRGDVRKFERGLHIKVEYTLPDGTPVNPAVLERGTDFVCKTIIVNTGTDCNDIALSQMFPCGWEIRQDRGDDAGMYQDWRDDRVYSYFNLAAGSSVQTVVRLTATYAGRYYHPAFTAEAMYDDTVRAVLPGFETEVR